MRRRYGRVRSAGKRADDGTVRLQDEVPMTPPSEGSGALILHSVSDPSVNALRQ
jgi:hypothetical protein